MNSPIIDQVCATHTSPRALHCINCRQNLCRLCRHYTINSRIWCQSCAKIHLPSAGGAAADLVRFLVKLAGLAIATALPILWAPGIVPKLAAACIAAGLYLRFVVLRSFGDSQILIDEVTDGRRSRIG